MFVKINDRIDWQRHGDRKNTRRTTIWKASRGRQNRHGIVLLGKCEDENELSIGNKEKIAFEVEVDRFWPRRGMHGVVVLRETLVVKIEIELIEFRMKIPSFQGRNDPNRAKTN